MAVFLHNVRTLRLRITVISYSEIKVRLFGKHTLSSLLLLLILLVLLLPMRPCSNTDTTSCASLRRGHGLHAHHEDAEGQHHDV